MLDSERATLQPTGSHRQTRGIDDATDDDAADEPAHADPDAPAAIPTSGDPCPLCGTEIEGMDVAGPGDYELLPCGHSVGGRQR